MARIPFAIAAIAAGLAFTPLSAAPAQALTVTKPVVSKDVSGIVKVRRGGFRRGFGGRRFGHRGFRGGFARRGFRYGGFRRGRRYRGLRFYSPYLYAAPYYYGYSYSYGRSCYWLKRKARRTGSRYWWRRYRRCRDYYY